MKRTDILGRKEDILQWISEHRTNSEIAQLLNCKVDTLKVYYEKMGIVYKGNRGGKGRKSSPRRKSASELIKNPNTNNAKKRRRLIEDGLKEAKCEICGLSLWMGRPIPLELHHKNFNHYDNSLENLQILCSNCHMQVHNYCNTL